MKIADADLCTYLARNESSFLFLPDHETFTTRLILRTTNEAWQLDKIPTLAICSTERSANVVQTATGIKTVCAEKFFADLERARPVTYTFTGKKSFVIGHDENPKGRFDDIVLASFANVIVYDAHNFSAEHLATLCDPVSQVRGRLILCGDWNALDRAHPDIAETISDALGQGLHVVPDSSATYHPEKAWQLGNELDFDSAPDNPALRSGDARPWVIVATCWWEDGTNVVRAIHSSQEDALNAVPAVFAEEWRNYIFLCHGDWTDRQPPSVSAAEWRATLDPEIGQRVRIENHAVVSVSALDELPQSRLPDDRRPDTRATDPLARTRPFLVFHAKSGESTQFPDHYTLVARIEAESIDHAAFLSQRHAEVPWTKHPGVTPFADNPRSTQVGDVLIEHDVPQRYAGRHGWCPVKTNMEPAHVSQRGVEVQSAVCMPDADERQMAKLKP
jgi:hypothetical protein